MQKMNKCILQLGYIKLSMDLLENKKIKLFGKWQFKLFYAFVFIWENFPEHLIISFNKNLQEMRVR